MKRWRLAFLALFLFCAGSIAFALYHQLYNWLMPCLLCVYQRMAIIGIGIVALLTALFPQRRRAGVVLSCGAIASIGIAGAIAVGSYIGLVSVWGAPVSGASMTFRKELLTPGHVEKAPRLGASDFPHPQ